IFVAVVATGSLDLSRSSGTDRNSKAAFQAAQAGVEVARLRLSKLSFTSATCPNGTAPTLNGGRDCAAVSSSGGAPALGNGSAYSYYVSKQLNTGDPTCGGAASIVSNSTTGERCITSVGTSRGVQRRVQALVQATPPASPIFPQSMFADGQIDITENNNGSIT